MTPLEFFLAGFLLGVVLTLVLCAMARRNMRRGPEPVRSPVEQNSGSATVQAPDQLAKIGRETGAEIIDD